MDHGKISFQKKYSLISYHKIEKIAMRGLKKIQKYDKILGHHATGGLFLCHLPLEINRISPFLSSTSCRTWGILWTS
jgi:hypothetical protein